MVQNAQEAVDVSRLSIVHVAAIAEGSQDTLGQFVVNLGSRMVGLLRVGSISLSRGSSCSSDRGNGKG
jgi:hypothetical protein